MKFRNTILRLLKTLVRSRTENELFHSCINDSQPFGVWRAPDNKIEVNLSNSVWHKILPYVIVKFDYLKHIFHMGIQ